MNKKNNKKSVLYWFTVMFLLGLFVWGVQGCSLLSPIPLGTPDSEPGIGPCEANDDCLKGQECKLRYCRASVKSEKKGTLVSLKLIPPSHLRFKNTKHEIKITEQQFLGVDLNTLQNGSGTIWPREAYTLEGKLIAWNEKNTKQQVRLSAKIRFIDHNSIKGQPLIREVTTSDGQFKVQLSYGTYRVEIFPQDSHYPPKYLENIQVKEAKTLNIELPKLDSCEKLEGRLVSSDEKHQPLSEIELQVIDIDGRLISNKAITDYDGRFQIWLAPKQSPQSLRISLRTKPPLHPEMILSYSKLIAEKPKKDKTINLGHLPIGFSAKTVRLSGTIRSLLQEGSQIMADMPIRLSGIVSFGHYRDLELQGSYKLSLLSDNNGYYEVFIPPGKYQIEVLPPYNSSWARVSLQAQMITTSKDVNIELLKRYQIQGNICQAGKLGNCKRRISQAQIQAVWRDVKGNHNPKNSFYTMPPSHYKTEQTGLDGAYKLRLDPGVYDLTFIPPNDSGLARAFSRVCIRSQLVQRNAFLPEAKYLVGKLFGPDRFPIAGMVIEMYEYNAKGLARLLGRAVSLSQGQFSLSYAIPRSSEEKMVCK